VGRLGGVRDRVGAGEQGLFDLGTPLAQASAELPARPLDRPLHRAPLPSLDFDGRHFPVTVLRLHPAPPPLHHTRVAFPAAAPALVLAPRRAIPGGPTVGTRLFQLNRRSPQRQEPAPGSLAWDRSGDGGAPGSG